jgi:hypothetical protein
MGRRIRLLFAITILPCTLTTGAAEPAATSSEELALSSEVLELLRAEMREVAAAVQTITTALPIGGWQGIHEAALGIRNAYVMNRLTDAQARELEQALPPGFLTLDHALHGRAQQLADAAHDKNAELVTFHFSRMLETCTQCHAAFAAERFPGFEAIEPEASGHHH